MISPSTIRRIYLKHKIRFKNIKRGKREIDFSEAHYLSLFHRMRALVKQMEESQTRVVRELLLPNQGHIQEVVPGISDKGGTIRHNEFD
jgi:hypothetical protein